MAALAVEHVIYACPVFIGYSRVHPVLYCFGFTAYAQANQQEQRQQASNRSALELPTPHLFDGNTNDDRRGTVVDRTLRAETPVEIIALRWDVHGAIAFVAITQAISTG